MVGKWRLDPNHQCREWIEKHYPTIPPKNPRAFAKAVPFSHMFKYYPNSRGFRETYYGPMHSHWATHRLDGSPVPGKGQRITTKGDGQRAGRIAGSPGTRRREPGSLPDGRKAGGSARRTLLTLARAGGHSQGELENLDRNPDSHGGDQAEGAFQEIIPCLITASPSFDPGPRWCLLPGGFGCLGGSSEGYRPEKARRKATQE